jgi:hypothetical protein
MHFSQAIRLLSNSLSEIFFSLFPAMSAPNFSEQLQNIFAIASGLSAFEAHEPKTMKDRQMIRCFIKYFDVMVPGHAHVRPMDDSGKFF